MYNPVSKKTPQKSGMLCKMVIQSERSDLQIMQIGRYNKKQNTENMKLINVVFFWRYMLILNSMPATRIKKVVVQAVLMVD